MLVLVAGDAGGRDAEKCFVQIFKLDVLTFTLRHVLRGVASITRQPRVLAFERVSSLLVVKALDVPLDQRKIHAVVLGVAADAFLA